MSATSSVLPSLYVPVAVNASVVPNAKEEFAGFTAIDINAAGFTVIAVDPEIIPEAAVIVAVPAPALVARPPAAMVATAVWEDVHVAVLVRSCVLPSLKVPVAENC